MLAPLVAVGALSACQSDATGPEEDARLALFAAGCPNPAPLELTPGQRVPDHFIVVYADAVTDPNARTNALAAKYGFTTTHRYSSALKGFAAKLSPATVAGLRCEAGVKYIEEDAVVKLGG